MSAGKYKLALAGISLAAITTAVVSLTGSASAAPHSAKQWGAPRCGLATLHGTYLFKGDGTALTSQGDQPMAYAGSLDMDGAGHLTGYISSSLNGTVDSDTAYTGTYTVASNCTGNLTIENIIFDDLFTGPSGNEFTYVQTNEAQYPGSDQDVSSADAQRVSPF